MGGFAEVELAGELGGSSQWPSQESLALCDFCFKRVYVWGTPKEHGEGRQRSSGDGDSDKNNIRQRVPGSDCPDADIIRVPFCRKALGETA